MRALWLIGGNINITHFIGEPRGPELHLASMAYFNDLISELSLIEPTLCSRKFTWSNDHQSSSCAKLHYFLYSPNWNDAFPLSSRKALLRSLSYYILLTLNIRIDTSYPPKFYFKNMWTFHPSFKQDISSFWRSLAPTSLDLGARLISKFRLLWRFLKRWAKSHFGNIT